MGYGGGLFLPELFKGLYENINIDSRTKYLGKAILGGLIPPLGAVWYAMDSMRYMDDYLDNRGMSYDDIEYPTMTQGYNGVSSASRSGYAFVSKNLTRMYK